MVCIPLPTVNGAFSDSPQATCAERVCSIIDCDRVVKSGVFLGFLPIAGDQLTLGKGSP